MARPTKFSQSFQETFCDRIAEGESLRKICQDKSMPSSRTVTRWLEDNEAFRLHYAQARQRQAERYAEEIAEIADEMPPPGPNGGTDSGWVQWQKNRVEARKWIAAKLLPKVYGDRIKAEVEHSGSVDVNVSLQQAKAIADEFRKLQGDET